MCYLFVFILVMLMGDFFIFLMFSPLLSLQLFVSSDRVFCCVRLNNYMVTLTCCDSASDTFVFCV